MRTCTHYRAVNDCAEETRHPVKNQHDVLQRLKGKKRFGVVDLRKGYHQVKLTKRASLILAVITHQGIVIPVTAPFGFHGLPAQFQYYVSELVLGELDGHGVEAFIDDLNINADTFEEFLELLEQVFVKLDKWDLRINGSKTELNLPSCIYLGRHIDGEGRQHKEDRLAGIEKIQRPYDKHQTKSFMSLVNYFREHCGMDFADKTATINKMLKKDAQFIWTDACQEAFESIKQSILENQKLYWLDYEKNIYFRCDASKIGCGAQLFQHDENGRELSVAYISHTFSQAEQNWSTLEQELFAAVWSTKTWMSQLEGAHFTISTDQKNILQLQKSQAPKVIRWRLAMQQFSYDIVHVAGTDSRHAVADCLSRLHGPAKGGTLSTAAMTRSRAKLDGAMSMASLESGKQELLKRSSGRLKALEAAKVSSDGHHPETDAVTTDSSGTIERAGPAIDSMQLPQSSTAMDGTDPKNKRKRSSEEDPEIPKKSQKTTVKVEKTVAKNSKRKRDSNEEVSAELPSSPSRKVKVIRQNFTNCKLCNESFPTKRCEADSKKYKQFCATCWALKEPECREILNLKAQHNMSCVLCGTEYTGKSCDKDKAGLDNPECGCCPKCWKQDRQHCIEAQKEMKAFHEDFNLERCKKAKKTGETEETEETEDGDHQILDSTSTVAKKPVAVSPQTRAIFNVYHNSIVGHMGQERTRQRLMDAEASGAIADPSHIPDKKQLEWLIQTCRYCQKLRLRKRDLDVARASLMTKGPFDECSLDVIGPLPPDENGNKFIIVMIDNFSHFVFAEPIKDTTAESAAKFIIKVSATFGLPKAFRWDNCSQFEGHLVRCLLALIRTGKNPSVPYNPETNGIVERVIQEIMRHLRFICNEKRMQTEWDIYLPLVLRILNAEPVATIGLSPAEILLPGIDLQAGFFPTTERAAKASVNAIPDPARRKAIQQWLTHLQELQVQAIRVAGERAALVKRKIKAKQPKVTRKFDEGDYVVTEWRANDRNVPLTKDPAEFKHMLTERVDLRYAIASVARDGARRYER